MTTDDFAALKQELIADEGIRLTPYRDTVGKWTIGVGRNLTDKGISLEEAMTLLEHDIDATYAEMTQAMPWTQRLDGPRLRALLNIGFNAGIAGLMGFHRMLAAIQIGDHDTAAKEIVDSHLAPARATRLAALMRTAR